MRSGCLSRQVSARHSIDARGRTPPAVEKQHAISAVRRGGASRIGRRPLKTIVHFVGARPNFMKISPLMESLRTTPCLEQLLVNTGQHYDDAMSRAFVRDLGLPTPDYDLGVGSASHAVQTARVMIEFEKVCLETQPDLVVVVGDVNSTVAAS